MRALGFGVKAATSELGLCTVVSDGEQEANDRWRKNWETGPVGRVEHISLTAAPLREKKLILGGLVVKVYGLVIVETELFVADKMETFR